jgi:hypothetical protein
MVLLIIIILLLFILIADGISLGGSGTTIRHNTKITHITKIIHHAQFFNLCSPPSRTMALGFTQPLTEMSIKRSFWG